jgi:diacylglycerol O-acyltransferase / wax synthase
LPAGADREVLISELHSDPLDWSRPMWMAYVIYGMAGGRFAFYIKVHHTVVDGVAGLKVIADALTTDPENRSMRPIYATAPEATPPSTAPAHAD